KFPPRGKCTAVAVCRPPRGITKQSRPQDMNNRYPEIWRALVLALPLCSVNAVYAQDTDPALDDEDEVVVLSPFEVTSERNVGYMTAGTLSGSRIRTDL